MIREQRNQKTKVADGLEKIDIRPASPKDQAEAAALIYLPMGALADFLFGVNIGINSRTVLEQLFAEPMNRFSYQFSDIMEVDSRIAGLVLAYPAQVLKSLALPMGRQLLQILGLGGVRCLLRRARAFAEVKETEPDDYYIYTLSIHPEFQNQKLGTRLLAHAEGKASSAGFTKISLGVTIGNERARRFYERCGYSIVETFFTPDLEERIGHKGYHRMVKDLSKS